jgi:AP-4 complex subunit sigma-1
MGIKFILMVNKQGQTRLANYYDWHTIEERSGAFRCGLFPFPPLHAFARRGSAGRRRRRGRAPPPAPCRRPAAALESEIIRKCLSRTEMQCSFMDYRGMRVVYRRYASLFFIVGTDPEEDNELGVLEFIHALVETLDKYFENVCELDIMFNLEKAQFILDEMVTNGAIVETNKANILKPILLLEKVSGSK